MSYVFHAKKFLLVTLSYVVWLCSFYTFFLVQNLALSPFVVALISALIITGVVVFYRTFYSAFIVQFPAGTPLGHALVSFITVRTMAVADAHLFVGATTVPAFLEVLVPRFSFLMYLSMIIAACVVAVGLVLPFFFSFFSMLARCLRAAWRSE